MNDAAHIGDCLFPVSLPEGATILVKEGDSVFKKDVLAVKEEEEFKEINLPRVSLLVSPGERVEKDQVIARKKGFFGKEMVFKSPVPGIFSGVSKNGLARIKIKEEKTEIYAPFSGEVKEIKDSFLLLKFKAAVLKGDWGSGPKEAGAIEMLGERDEDGELSDILPEHSGKILVVGGRIFLGVAHKAEAMGVKGMIAGSAPREAWIGDLPILVFADKEGLIPKEIWLGLKKEKGREVCISGEEKSLYFPLK